MRTATRVTFGDVLRVAEFRWMWLADSQSLVGDQLSRVAIAYLVYSRTDSAILTAAFYALTFLPALFGGALFGEMVDRLPRRRVLVTCNVVRLVVVGAMALPGVSTAVLVALVVVATFTGSLFDSAEAAMLPDVLDAELYPVGSGLRSITHQCAVLAGFLAGGAITGLFGAHTALAVDAASFGISALVLLCAIRERPAADPAPVAAGGNVRRALAGVEVVRHNRRLRLLLALACLAGLFVIPEGIAAPYAHSLGSGAGGTGLLMACDPAGTAVGAFLFMRLVPDRLRVRWIGPLAVACGLPLVACALHPGLVWSAVLWTLCGVLSAYQVQVMTDFSRTVDPRHRGRAIGVASSALVAAQGIGVCLGGVGAQELGPGHAVVWAGVAGIVCAVPLALRWRSVSVGD